MIDPMKEANKIVDKILNSSVLKAQLAVFVFPDGSVKTTKPTTELFREALKRNPKMLCGVYDEGAMPRDVAEDIIVTLQEQGVFIKAAA